jgi:hypothetical protein
MKKNIFPEIGAIVLIGFALMFFLRSDHTWGQAPLRQSLEPKFEEYRAAIKDNHQIDDQELQRPNQERTGGWQTYYWLRFETTYRGNKMGATAYHGQFAGT